MREAAKSLPNPDLTIRIPIASLEHVVVDGNMSYTQVLVDKVVVAIVQHPSLQIGVSATPEKVVLESAIENSRARPTPDRNSMVTFYRDSEINGHGTRSSWNGKDYILTAAHVVDTSTYIMGPNGNKMPLVPTPGSLFVALARKDLGDFCTLQLSSEHVRFLSLRSIEIVPPMDGYISIYQKRQLGAAMHTVVTEGRLIRTTPAHMRLPGVGFYQPYNIDHSASTIGSTSGSGVIQKLKLIGVHTAGHNNKVPVEDRYNQCISAYNTMVLLHGPVWIKPESSDGSGSEGWSKGRFYDNDAVEAEAERWRRRMEVEGDKEIDQEEEYDRVQAKLDNAVDPFDSDGSESVDGGVTRGPSEKKKFSLGEINTRAAKAGSRVDPFKISSASKYGGAWADEPSGSDSESKFKSIIRKVFHETPGSPVVLIEQPLPDVDFERVGGTQKPPIPLESPVQSLLVLPGPEIAIISPIPAPSTPTPMNSSELAMPRVASVIQIPSEPCQSPTKSLNLSPVLPITQCQQVLTCSAPPALELAKPLPTSEAKLVKPLSQDGKQKSSPSAATQKFVLPKKALNQIISAMEKSAQSDGQNLIVPEWVRSQDQLNRLQAKIAIQKHYQDRADLKILQAEQLFNSTQLQGPVSPTIVEPKISKKQSKRVAKNL